MAAEFFQRGKKHLKIRLAFAGMISAYEPTGSEMRRDQPRDV
jgi:hypothetical protein